ncbi:MAG: RNA polymerase sigma factor [Spirosomaceae bacterium]|nr:RNA polymerase sigma factor [Spirosomataceae bacterium]
MEEHTLIASLKSRNEAAFRQLVETYQVRVYNTVLSLIQHNEEAEDIAQEVFIEVYRSVENFREDSTLSTWIYRIATTKSLEAIRKKKTQKRFAFLTSLFGKNDELLHQSPDFEHPGVVAENKELSQTLFEAISKLPDNQRIAYTLVNVEGLSYVETAEAMDITKSSVESLIFRAKGNLKKLLKTYYEEDFG